MTGVPDLPGDAGTAPFSKRLWAGWWLGVAFGGPAAYGLVVLTADAWATCDVGINAAANGFTLLFVLPLLWGANATAFGVAYATVSLAGWARRPLAIVAGLLVLTMLAWALFATFGTPAGYPDPMCPANVPPWWPSWIPA